MLALAAIGAATSSWEGVSYEDLKRTFRDTLGRDPIDSLLAMVLGCSYLFWLAERDDNPKCRGFLDALVFVTTNLSVGYCDIFARTEAGKAIAAFVMTFGPALATDALEPPAAEAARDGEARADVNRAILDRLDAILEEIRARPDPL